MQKWRLEPKDHFRVYSHVKKKHHFLHIKKKIIKMIFLSAVILTVPLVVLSNTPRWDF